MKSGRGSKRLKDEDKLLDFEKNKFEASSVVEAKLATQPFFLLGMVRSAVSRWETQPSALNRLLP